MAWLKPIYDKMHQLLCVHTVLHADETTLQVLHESDRAAQAKSTMWLYRTSADAEHQIVLYDYQTSRSGAHPKQFLQGFTGFLHTDGWEEYHRKLPREVTLVGCWAHCRRKFDEALKTLPEKDRAGSVALRGKLFCDKLFDLERSYEALVLDDHFTARKLARLEQTKPVMDAFFSWCAQTDVLPKSLPGQAIRYARSQRARLERVLLDGRLELSNNRAERSVKPFVIGRKNWLFNNTPVGANASAMIYSIVETAKENGVKPYDYLAALLRKAPNMAASCSLDALLPWNLGEGI